MCPQTPEVEQLGRVVELDSDMADITQELPQESVLEDNMMEEQEAVPASTHIASTLGINPHVLQVGVLYFPPKGEDFVVPLSNFSVCPPRLVTNQLVINCALRLQCDCILHTGLLCLEKMFIDTRS